jgi:hypothetical protein
MDIEPTLVVGAVIATPAVGYGLVWIVRKLRRLGHLIDDLAGVPARMGRPAQPGIVQKLDDHTSRLVRIEQWAVDHTQLHKDTDD